MKTTKPRVWRISDRSAPKDAVYIGRPTKWGNPFVVGLDGSRDGVVEKYRKYLLSKPGLCQDAKRELAGKDLICFCAPLRCHGDVLLEVANQPAEEE